MIKNAPNVEHLFPSRVDTSENGLASSSRRRQRYVQLYVDDAAFSANNFSIFSKRSSIAPNRLNICLSILLTSSAGAMGMGVGEGHGRSHGLSGRLGHEDWRAVAFSFFSSSLIRYHQ